jgi:NADH pyrophosphatase NudC (nudix superfamily)
LEQYFDERDKPLEKRAFKFCPLCSHALNIEGNNNYCSKCDFVQYINPLPCVSVLIRNESGQILIGKRISAKKLWCLPCGFIEEGENFLIAAHREVKEETNLEISIESIVNVVTNEYSKFQSLVIVLLSSKKTGVECAGDDLSELQWIDNNYNPELLEFKADKFIIDKYFSEDIQGVGVDDRYSTY